MAQTNTINKLRRANEIRVEEGYLKPLESITWFIYSSSFRKIMPIDGYYTNAGIPVNRKKSFDSIVPGNPYSDSPKHESAIISALKNHVCEGDDIVVVGAGTGTTSIIAAKQAGKSGSVIAYDGSDRQVKKAKQVFVLNDVEDRCDVQQRVVGPAIHLASSEHDTTSEHKSLPIAELPECDVLELDCEGAEKTIVEKMQIRPRVIIAETHPHFDSSPEQITDLLENKDYEVIKKVDRKTVPVLIAMPNREA